MQAAANAVQGKMGSMPTTIDTEYKSKPDGSTMRALAWFGTRDVRMIDAPRPAITNPDDIILKITGTTICGSDLHLYNAEILALQKGDILGHEFCGIVDEVGPNVKNRKKGDRVVVSFQCACGFCDYCKEGLSSFCDNTNDSSLMSTMYGQRDAGFFGYSHFTGGFAGGQAEYVRVPYGENNCLPIPDSVPDEKALYLSDILPTSYHCVVDTGVTKGDTVGIWGLGPIGMCAAKFSQLKGAKRIIGIDCVPERLAFARDVLGIETIDFKEHTDVAKKILEMVPRGLDKALDCGTFHEPKTLLHKVEKALMLETDVSETANECIKSVRKMGSVGVISAYAGYTNHFNIGALMEKGVRFIGNGQAPVHKYWEELMKHIAEGSFDPLFIVSHRFTIEDFPELYAKFQKRAGGVEKVYVETQFSSSKVAGPKLTKIADL